MSHCVWIVLSVDRRSVAVGVVSADHIAVQHATRALLAAAPGAVGSARSIRRPWSARHLAFRDLGTGAVVWAA
jgi:hypothetical protein